MKKMTSNEIRKAWLNFFKGKNHEIIDSVSLVPKNDNSLLWINSGVAGLKDFFSGVSTPVNNRMTNSQKCLRTLDMKNVGITSRHHTFFEMLGNFSIGDYFKKGAIEFAFELLINVFEMDINKLYITVFNEDEETYEKWIQLGIDKARIIKNGKDRNFWDLGSGPCGPCTEIYYDRGEEFDLDKKGFELFEKDIENDRFIEIWNIVFSEFSNDGSGNYSKLTRKNIDTGAGLERLACVSQNARTNFETDLFMGTIKIIEKNSQFKYVSNPTVVDEIKKTQAFRVIVDHLRSAIFAIADGVNPSGKDRGNILRKLVRRIFIELSILDVNSNIIEELINSQVDILSEGYSYLKASAARINSVFYREKVSFEKTMDETNTIFKNWISQKTIDAKELFNLVDTYGFPMEFIDDFRINNFESYCHLAKLSDEEKKVLKEIKIDFEAFDKHFKEHKIISKKTSNSSAMNKQNEALLNLDLKSEFSYEELSMLSKIIKIYDEDFNEVEKTANGIYYIVLNKTPFYATSGGQIHDTGKINGHQLLDVFKAPNGQNIHKLLLDEKTELLIDKLVDCQVDTEARAKTTAAHSAEHLLHEALKSIIDKNIRQEGAFKSPEKLTFDFYYPEKLSEEKINDIESYINNIISSNIPTEFFNLTLDEALKMGAVAYFEDKYKKIEGKLRVVKIGGVSTELCGGTHVKNSSEIERFLIVKLESKGSGLWRIESMVSNKNCFEYTQKVLAEETAKIQEYVADLKSREIKSSDFQNQLVEISKILKSGKNVIREFVKATKVIFSIYQKLIAEDNIKKNIESAKKLKTMFSPEKEYQEFVVTNNMEPRAIQNALGQLINEMPLKAFIVLNVSDDEIKYFAMQNPKTQTFDCQALIKALNEKANGRGGGKFHFAQGGTSNINSIDHLIEVINERNLN